MTAHDVLGQEIGFPSILAHQVLGWFVRKTNTDFENMSVLRHTQARCTFGNSPAGAAATLPHGQTEPTKASDLDIYNDNENVTDIAINSDNENDDEHDEIDDTDDTDDEKNDDNDDNNDDDIDIEDDDDNDNHGNVENPEKLWKTYNPFSFYSRGAFPRFVAYHFDFVYIHGQGQLRCSVDVKMCPST